MVREFTRLHKQNFIGNDFAIQLEDGTTLQISLSNEATIGDVINTINNAPGNGGLLTARLAASGNGIEWFQLPRERRRSGT